jgi:hypothetical protein
MLSGNPRILQAEVGLVGAADGPSTPAGGLPGAFTGPQFQTWRIAGDDLGPVVHA